MAVNFSKFLSGQKMKAIHSFETSGLFTETKERHVTEDVILQTFYEFYKFVFYFNFKEQKKVSPFVTSRTHTHTHTHTHTPHTHNPHTHTFYTHTTQRYTHSSPHTTPHTHTTTHTTHKHTHTCKEHSAHICMLFSHIEGREILLLMLTFRTGFKLHWE